MNHPYQNITHKFIHCTTLTTPDSIMLFLDLANSKAQTSTYHFVFKRTRPPFPLKQKPTKGTKQ